jgi:hypothetical protein
MAVSKLVLLDLILALIWSQRSMCVVPAGGLILVAWHSFFVAFIASCYFKQLSDARRSVFPKNKKQRMTNARQALVVWYHFKEAESHTWARSPSHALQLKSPKATAEM